MQTKHTPTPRQKVRYHYGTSYVQANVDEAGMHYISGDQWVRLLDRTPYAGKPEDLTICG